MMKEKIVALILILIICSSCNKKSESINISPKDFHASIDKVTEVMIHDIFSPPVASRIYAYPNIGAYEILALENDSYKSLVGQINGLEAIPNPEQITEINCSLAALITHIELSKQLIFSEDRIEAYRDSLYGVWQDLNENEFKASKNYGLKVAAHIASWMDKDNYKQTRTMPKFTVDSDNPSRWQPTPPSYMEGIEPHWNK